MFKKLFLVVLLALALLMVACAPPSNSVDCVWHEGTSELTTQVVSDLYGVTDAAGQLDYYVAEVKSGTIILTAEEFLSLHRGRKISVTIEYPGQYVCPPNAGSGVTPAKDEAEEIQVFWTPQ